MASRIRLWLGLVGLELKSLVLGLGLASQASRVYLCRMSIHAAKGEASRVHSISLCKKTTSTPVAGLGLGLVTVDGG